MKKKGLFVCLAVLLYMAVWSASAAGAEITDYDGYSFTQWVTSSGDMRASSFAQVDSTIFMDMGGTGNNGMRLTFEAAGDGQYYIRSTFRYNKTYLSVGGQNSAGEYYLGGTTNQGAALKWRLGSDGRLYTTYKDVEYFLWMYCDQLPYNGSDGFRLTTDKTNSDAIAYKRMTLTPPDPLHNHPVCGAECGHESEHEALSAVKYSNEAIDGYGVNTTMLKSGDYYLDSDLTTSNNFAIFGTVRLCLNGHNLTFKNGRGFKVYGNLEICDCQGGGSVTSLPKDEGSYSVYEDLTISVEKSASMTIYGGVYCEESGTDISNYGSLNVYGGNFGQLIGNRGTMTIHEGIFTTKGSAIENYSAGTASILGGSFHAEGSDNYSSECIYSAGKMDIKGIKII